MSHAGELQRRLHSSLKYNLHFVGLSVNMTSDLDLLEGPAVHE